MQDQEQGKARFESMSKCGWVDAVQSFNVSYNRRLLIEKPGPAVKGSPPPEKGKTVEDKGIVAMMQAHATHFKSKKRKIEDEA